MLGGVWRAGTWRFCELCVGWFDAIDRRDGGVMAFSS